MVDFVRVWTVEDCSCFSVCLWEREILGEREDFELDFWFFPLWFAMLILRD